MEILSVIIPFFNEEENLQRIYEELDAFRKSELSHCELEVIYMGNHSTDRSFEVASEIARNDSSSKVIRLSRNFGYQANILTGFLNCRGGAAIQLDADGEDDSALLNYVSSVPIPLEAGDFRLIDRRVMNALSHFRESNLYLPGLIAYAVFKQTGIEYDRSGELNSGALPYRENEAMSFFGANRKFTNLFGEVELTPLKKALEKTIAAYRTDLER